MRIASIHPMDKDAPATSNDTPLPADSVAEPKSALNQPAKTPVVGKLALTTLIIVGAALVLVGVLLVAVVSFVFIQWSQAAQSYQQTAAAKTAQIESHMRQLKIAGKPPQTVVGSVTDRNGEDFIGVNTVPSVDATFLVSEPSVTAAQTETHTDLAVKSSGTLSIWPQAGNGEAKGLKEQITTAGDASYYVIYFFKTPVAYTPADSGTCSTTPTPPRECTDGYIIDTMHLVSRPVSVIRLGV